MPLDIELPLWTIRPNWKDGVTERLSWLTDVLGNGYGVEQRRALRLSPRREFEMNFNPVDATRSYFDLFLHRLGWTEFMLPLYHDRGKLSAGIGSGATVLPVDTTYREFVVGGLALILGDDAFTYDKVQITAIADNSITVAAGGVTKAWTKGTSIYPLRRSRIEQESLVSALTNRVGQATIRFELNQANDLADEGAWGVLYNGYPMLLTPPNRRENIDLNFLRNSLVLDNEVGLRQLSDQAGRAFTLQTYDRLIRGRADRFDFRQFLYRLRGQQSAIWIPTFNRDIEITRDKLAADANLDIRKIGYGYTGGAVSGRRHVLLPGGVIREITGTAGAMSAVEERVTLNAALGTPMFAGGYGSFMEPCRLGSDDIEIVHRTDEIAECSLSFRAFRDERVPPTVLAATIPAAPMETTGCGSPATEEASCVDLPYFLWQIEISWWAGGNAPLHYPVAWAISAGSDAFPDDPATDAYSNIGILNSGGSFGVEIEQTGEGTIASKSVITVPYHPTVGYYTSQLRNYKLDYQFHSDCFATGGVEGGGRGTVYYRKSSDGGLWHSTTIYGDYGSPRVDFTTERLWPRTVYFKA